MGIEELVNKGIESFGNVNNFKEEKKTLIVIGVARGGTSLLAGVIDALGIFTGEQSKAPVYEDVTLAEAFESNNKRDIKRIIEYYNNRDNIWMFKRPSSIHYLRLIEKYIHNPIYLIVFKDIFSIANRNSISMKSDSLSVLNQAHNDYAKILKYLNKRKGKINGILYSYDKVMQNRSEFIDSLVEIIGKDNIDIDNIQKAHNFIDPNSKAYLDATRITKSVGEVISFNGKSIEGWAKLVHLDKSIKVELLLNGKVIDSTFTNYKDEKLKKPYGFEFKLKNNLDLKDKFEIKVAGDIVNLKKTYKKLDKKQVKVDFEKIEFTNSIKNDVLIAKDNWLFLFQGGQRQFDYLTGKYVATQKSILNFATNIHARISYCREKNITYSHVVFPSKPLVKKSYLDSNLQGIESLFERDYLETLIDVMGSTESNTVFYPLEYLRKIEENNSCFLKLDTHMTDYANVQIVNYLLKKLDLESNIDTDKFSLENMSGDLANMINSPMQHKEKILTIDSKMVYSFDNRKYLPSNSNNIVITYSKNSITSQRLLIFGDSFFKSLLKFLTPFFRDIVYIRSAFMHHDIVELYNPDVIFTGNAERYMSKIEPDTIKENILLALYGGHDYRPSLSFKEAFKAEFSYAYYPKQYLAWSEKIEKNMEYSLALKEFESNQLICHDEVSSYTSIGLDPYFIFSKISFEQRKTYLFEMTYVISINSIFQIFYSDLMNNKKFSETMSFKEKVFKGLNKIEIILDYPLLGEWLRIDPMNCEGDFEIQSMSLKEL